jgi:hypothetical protein
MKKLSIVLTAITVLALMLAVTAFAVESTEYGVNIAGSYSSLSKNPADAWNVGVQYLVDGDRTTGTSAYHHTRYTEMTVTFDRDIMFETLVFVTNSNGTFPTTGHSFSAKTEFKFWFSVKLLDGNGNVVTDVGTLVCGSNRENENGEIVVDLSNNLKTARSIHISMDTQWNNGIGLWELEAYEHSCVYDTIKERYKEETCMDDGEGKFACKCGSTADGIIPARGYHTYREDAVFDYANGYLQSGTKRFYCQTCDAYEGGDTAPIFKFLGYSMNRASTSICAGYSVNKELLKEYEEANNTTIKYGVLYAMGNLVKPLNDDGSVVSSEASIKKEMKESSLERFDIKLTTRSWEAMADYQVVMCAYLHEGDKISYICNEKSPDTQALPISYNLLKGSN